MQVSSSSAKGGGKKLATNGNSKLIPCGPCLKMNPPSPPPPTDSVSANGQSPVKIDGKPALGSGAEFTCQLMKGSISVAAPGQTSTKYETSTSISIKDFAAAAVGSVAGGRDKKVDNEDEEISQAAKEPVGRKGSELENSSFQKTRNRATTIENRSYSGHALDEMQNSGIPPRVVENTIQNGKSASRKVAGKMTTNYYDKANNITVATNDKGGVITVSYGKMGRGLWK